MLLTPSNNAMSASKIFSQTKAKATEIWCKFSISNVFAGMKEGIKAMKPSRPMKFPYTFAAKVVQFPWKFYFQNNWIWRYYPLGVLLSAPVFWYIETIAKSPANVATWAEIRRKESEETHHH